LEKPPDLSQAEIAEIQQALQVFNDLSAYQTLGVCADSVAMGKAAMEAYVAALSRPVMLAVGDRPGAIYLKFNTLNGVWHLDDYPGNARGMLVTFHGAEPEVDAVNGTYGPFPLTLFPAPSSTPKP
jgi:hypothetical protein